MHNSIRKGSIACLLSKVEYSVIRNKHSGSERYISGQLSESQIRQTKFKCDELKALFLGPGSVKESLRYFDDISNELCLLADVCYFLSIYSPDNEKATLAKNILDKATEIMEDFNSDPVVYDRLRELQNIVKDKALDHILEKLVLDFKKYGIHSTSKERSDLICLRAKISHVGEQFCISANNPVIISTRRCPTPLLPLSFGSKNLSLNKNHLKSPFDDVRESSWKLFHKYNAKREELLVSLVNSRHSLALGSGFSNHIDKELAGSLAGSSENVQKFLDELHYNLKPLFEQEMAYFNQIKRTGEPANLWDIDYYSAECSSKLLQDVPVFKSNFPLDNVLKAIDEFSQTFLHVQLTLDEYEKGKLWHDDVIKYNVYCIQEGDLLGVMYCDLFTRPGKSDRISLHTLQSGTTKQLPVVALVCNFTKNSNLQYKDIELLFHEFGHALHAIFGRNEYQCVSGARCPTDFAEIPSILFESLISRIPIFEKLMLGTNEVSDDFIRHLSCSDFFSSTSTLMQIYLSTLDLYLHSSSIKDTQSVARTVQRKYLSPFDIPNSTAWHQRFSHLYFYGGRYYSYLWSKAIVNMIINQFNLTQELRFVPEIRQLLTNGASKSCNSQIEAILGKPLAISDMTESLIKPLSFFHTKFYKSN